MFIEPRVAKSIRKKKLRHEILILASIENHAQLIRFIQRGQIEDPANASELAVSHAEELVRALEERGHLE